MAAVKPSLASYARVAYARELSGDRRGAAAAMNLALDAAGGVPEPTAWAHVELAKLALGDGSGRRSRASTCAQPSPIFPGYVLALEQKARVDAARGQARRRCRHSAAGGDRRPAPAVRRVARRPARSPRPDDGGGAPASDRRGHRPGAGRERPTRRPRERRLPGRPPHPAGGNGSSRAPRPCRAGPRSTATTRSAGRSRAQEVRRGRAVARPRAPDWHEGRTPLLPSRVRSRLRRRPACDARVVPPGARAEPGLFGAVGAGRPRGARMRRLAAVAAALVVVGVILAQPREASAHPLGNFTVNHYAGIELAGDRVFVRYVLDLAEIPTFQSGDRVRAPRLSSELAQRARSPARRRASRPAPAGAPRLGAPGSRRPPDPEVRGRLRRAAPRFRAHLRRPQLREPHRLAGGHRACPRRGAPRLVVRPGGEPLGRAALVSARPPSLAARGQVGDGAFRRRDGARCPSAARPVGGARPHGRRARGAHRARRHDVRRRPALLARGGVLGCRARPHARAREGARRRLPRRHPRPAEARLRARGHGHGHPHGGRVRASVS